MTSSDVASVSVESMPLDRPRIYVDLNEMIEPGLYLLSKTDTQSDSSGAPVLLREGDRVHVYTDDADDHGQPDALLAEGVVERNRETAAWAGSVPWCVRVDETTMRHYSELVAPTEGL